MAAKVDSGGSFAQACSPMRRIAALLEVTARGTRMTKVAMPMVM